MLLPTRKQRQLQRSRLNGCPGSPARGDGQHPKRSLSSSRGGSNGEEQPSSEPAAAAPENGNQCNGRLADAEEDDHEVRTYGLQLILCSVLLFAHFFSYRRASFAPSCVHPSACQLNAWAVACARRKRKVWVLFRENYFALALRNSIFAKHSTFDSWKQILPLENHKSQILK